MTHRRGGGSYTQGEDAFHPELRRRPFPHSPVLPFPARLKLCLHPPPGSTVGSLIRSRYRRPRPTGRPAWSGTRSTTSRQPPPQSARLRAIPPHLETDNNSLSCPALPAPAPRRPPLLPCLQVRFHHHWPPWSVRHDGKWCYFSRFSPVSSYPLFATTSDCHPAVAVGREASGIPDAG